MLPVLEIGVYGMEAQKRCWCGIGWVKCIISCPEMLDERLIGIIEKDAAQRSVEVPLNFLCCFKNYRRCLDFINQNIDDPCAHVELSECYEVLMSMYRVGKRSTDVCNHGLPWWWSLWKSYVRCPL